MKNSEYWKERFGQLEAAQHKKGADVIAEMEKQYKEAQKQIEGQIARWYQRLADNNGITLAQARQYLKAADLKEFKWDVQEYIKYGQDNALTGGWMKELENASAKFHITKLEALKVQTQQSLEVMFQKQLGTMTGGMAGVFESGYYHTAYELQKGFNIGWDIAGLDQSQIEKVLSKPWAVDGKNFSERIWGNKGKLISEVHGELTQNIMLGGDPQKAIDAIAKKMNASRYNAGRLVMTEEAYFSSAAQKDCFLELGVEEYEIVATLDSHTSEICRTLDGQHFPMKDYQAGVTAPPFHVFCRSTTAPYFDENFGDIGERAARDEETGKTYFIPDDMKYQEWEDTFVKGGDKSGFNVLDDGSALHYSHQKEDSGGGLQGAPVNGKMKGANGKEVIRVHTVGKINREIYKCIAAEIMTDEVIITDERIGHIRERRGADFLEKYERYFPLILSDPDYIFPDDRANTAIVCKVIGEGDGAVNLILRLVVEGDDPSYKNSILTAIRENSQRFAQRLRNNAPVYKKD